MHHGTTARPPLTVNKVPIAMTLINHWLKVNNNNIETFKQELEQVTSFFFNKQKIVFIVSLRRKFVIRVSKVMQFLT